MTGGKRQSKGPLVNAAIIFLLLISPALPLIHVASATTSAASGSSSIQPQLQSKPSTPSVTNPIQLTATSSDNFFLSGRNTALGTYILTYLGDNAVYPLSSDDTARASVSSVAWSNSVTGKIGYSSTSILGGLQAQNITLNTGEAYTNFTPGVSNIPAQQDQGTIAALETNSAAGTDGFMFFDTTPSLNSSTTPVPVDAPAISGYYNEIESQVESYNYEPSSWGDNFVGIADITLPGTNPQGPEFPVVLQLSLTPGANYDTWQQVSPSDWYPQSCYDNIPQVFRPTMPEQVLASGPSPNDYFWTREDFSFKLCQNTVEDGPRTGADIIYGANANSPIVSFATNATSYQGMPCRPVFLGSTCFEGLVGAWGNIVVYAVSSTTPESDNLWLYDISNNNNILLQAGVDYQSATAESGGLLPGFSSDGSNLIMINPAGQVVLYDGSKTLQTFKTNALFPGAYSGLVRVGDGWAVWLDNNDTLNFYSIGNGKLYQQPVDDAYSDGTALIYPMNFDFENGIATWLVEEQPPTSFYPQLVLFTTNATAALGLPSSSNLDQVSTRTVLDWANPPPEDSLTFPQVILSSTGNWVFVNAIAANSTYYQVFAFPTPAPSCSYTGVKNGSWTNSSSWGLGAAPTTILAGCTVNIPSGVSITVPASVGSAGIQDGGNVTVSPGGSLLLSASTKFYVNSAATLTENGRMVIVNGSSLLNNGGTTTTGANSTLFNSGTLSNTLGGGLFVNGALNNNGTIVSGGPFTISGTLTNGATTRPAYQVTSNYPGGTITNQWTMTITAKGSLVQSFVATFKNSGSGTITVQGLINIDNGPFSKSGLTNYGTITISKGGMMQINYYGSLVNGVTGTLNISQGGSLTTSIGFPIIAYTFLSTGKLNNNGTITNGANFLSTGTITNGGLLNTTSLDFINAGTISNTGTIFNSRAGKITNTGLNPVNITAPGGVATINNYGTINNTRGAYINNYNQFNNYAAIGNSGTIDSYNNLFNFEGGRIVSYTGAYIYVSNGQFGNSGGLRNYGNLSVGYTSKFSNSDFLNNTGVIMITSLGSFTNTGEIINSGVIKNYGSQSGGLLINQKGGSITNGGGTLDNYGTFVNSGNVTMDSSGSFNNYGSVSNNGTIDNGGTFTNYCDGTSVSVSGNSPTQTGCTVPTITTASGSAFTTDTPMINGTSDANALIVLTDNGVVVGQAHADSTGNWTITVSPLSGGVNTLSARAIGTNGNSTTSSTQIVVAGTASTASSTASSSSVSTSLVYSTPVSSSELLPGYLALVSLVVLVAALMAIRIRIRGRSEWKT